MMDFIGRKVFLSKGLVPYDSDGDGIMDSLVLSSTDKTIQMPINQNFDDIGLYEVPLEETIEVIDNYTLFGDISVGDIKTPDDVIVIDDISWVGGATGGTNNGPVKFCSDINNTFLCSKTVVQNDVIYLRPCFIDTGVQNNEGVEGFVIGVPYPPGTVFDGRTTSEYCSEVLVGEADKISEDISSTESYAGDTCAHSWTRTVEITSSNNIDDQIQSKAEQFANSSVCKTPIGPLSRTCEVDGVPYDGGMLTQAQFVNSTGGTITNGTIDNGLPYYGVKILEKERLTYNQYEYTAEVWCRP